MNKIQSMTKVELVKFLIKEMKPKNKRPEHQYPNLVDAYNIGYYDARSSDTTVLKKILELLRESNNV
jgi:hypothetical protein